MLENESCKLIIVFPPGAGGNHLRNLLGTNDNTQSLYRTHSRTVHARAGSNFRMDELLQTGVGHGHFGEIWSHQRELGAIHNKKFIILCPDTPECRRLLNQRRRVLKMECFVDGGYFDGEQVFLYEPFMYERYFDMSLDRIMNISLYEWFRPDITDVLDRMSRFLGRPIDTDSCMATHAAWLSNNF